MPAPPSKIRNFSIIAHVDHGKSTLADRILDVTGALQDREKKEQFLDKLELERERGITIKAQSVRLNYRAKSGETYQLQLIDTPGHVDFSYEVSSSLRACEGALLVVDATQSVQAQTVANTYLALDNNLTILPVLNKVDLPSADVDRAAHDIEEVIGLDCSGAMFTSGKTGLGVAELIEAVVERIPPPQGNPDGPLRALVFDSWYDAYRGAMVMLRIVDGTVRKGDKVRFMATGRTFEITELGCFAPHATALNELSVGEVGFAAASIKTTEDTKIGDTLTHVTGGSTDPLPGFKEVKPMVYAGLFPTDSADYESLRDALAKLHLNDSSFSYEPDTSEALGFGFRCGFLGLLHMEIIQERLEREYDMDLITTAPSVVYRAHTKRGETIRVDNPSKLPDPGDLQSIEEPIVKVNIHVPATYVGPVVALCEERRGIQQGMHFATQDHVVITYELPLGEVILDLHDKLKSATRGFASMDYELAGYRTDDLIKLDMLVNGEPLDALSTILHRDNAYFRGRALASKLKELIPAQQYEVAIQAAIGSKVVARTTVRALRKDVTAKCYGGDISRKRKLLEKQKEGKKRMKAVGNVEVPQEAFLAVLRLDDKER
ncbi:MAG TPA: translation elongation factor 4 [Polyangiaceae bacterium]|nr:translation elongation factor 4 [Polyangiaceae bacterium]